MSQELITKLHHLHASDQRQIIAIAGPPAAGKSTVTDALKAEFGRALAILPMDGFHLDNAILDQQNLRHRKGAPETFDASGFIHMVNRVKMGEPVFAPTFDRSLDLSRAAATEITDEKLIIIEGNYLLLNQAPWTQLRPLWDLSVWLEVSPATVEARCIQRWLDHDHSLEDATKRARENDVRNAHFVIENSAPADLVISCE